MWQHLYIDDIKANRPGLKDTKLYSQIYSPEKYSTSTRYKQPCHNHELGSYLDNLK